MSGNDFCGGTGSGELHRDHPGDRQWPLTLGLGHVYIDGGLLARGGTSLKEDLTAKAEWI